MIGTQKSFTVGEVAQMNDIPTKAVYRAIQCGELVAYRFNARTVRVPRGSVEAWLAECMRRAVSPVSRSGTSSNKRHNSA